MSAERHPLDQYFLDAVGPLECGPPRSPDEPVTPGSALNVARAE